MSRFGEVLVMRFSRACRLAALSVAAVSLAVLMQTLACCHQPSSRQTLAARQELVASDACLVPESGPYDPSVWRIRDALIRDSLLPDDRTGIILLAFEEPAFEQPRLTLLRTQGSVISVEVYELLEDPWELLARALQNGSAAPELMSVRTKVTMAQVSAKKSSSRRNLNAELERLLVDLWHTTLERTQYSESNAQILTGHADGTIFHLWSGAMGGMSHSPRQGSALAEVANVIEGLRSYAAGKLEYPALRSQVISALRRAKKGEPCLRPASYSRTPDGDPEGRR